MSIGKLSASALAAVGEITVAAANLKFDFTLLKVEAPREFQLLGEVLSPERRKEAEDGSSHATACRLAALFEPLLDRIPRLSAAYGTRVSEIASSPELNPKASSGVHGLFSSQVGADGTSIWAAATSGRSAIAIHLLACMLARIWAADEAISIWAEIVEERRREIRQDDSANELEVLARNAVASQRITRDDLAQWDASARAWLQCADDAKGTKLQQTQLLLALKNISLPINNITSTYKSVLSAWKSAMALAERLIAGQPQEVHDGAILLGLSAWHIFPDLVILGRTTTIIRQKDSLISAGGMLTLGLIDRPVGIDQGGISWCLPLAALNHYGDPVQTTRTLDSNSSRLSIEEAGIVALGGVLRTWEPGREDTLQAVELFVELWSYLCRHEKSLPREGIADGGKMSRSNSLNARPWRWLELLHDSAKAFLLSKGLARQRAMRLLQLGRRRPKQFLGYDSARDNDIFGLLDIDTFVPLLIGQETKIAFLRQWADHLSLKPDDILLQYGIEIPAALSDYRYRVQLTEEDRDDVADCAQEQQPAQRNSSHYTHLEYATAVMVDVESSKRAISGEPVITRRHKRWIAVVSDPQNKGTRGDAEDRGFCECTCQETIFHQCCCPEHLCARYLSGRPGHPLNGIRLRRTELESVDEVISDNEQLIILEANTDQKLDNVEEFIPDEYLYDEPLIRPDLSFSVNSLMWHGSPSQRDASFGHSGPNIKGRRFEFLWGRPGDAALYIWTKTDRRFCAELPPARLLPHWVEALRSNRIEIRPLLRRLWNMVLQYEGLFCSLDALAVASSIYQTLPGATIHPSLTGMTLRSSCWYRSYSSRLELQSCSPSPGFRLRDPRRNEIFACVALFESGDGDIHPDHLQQVMALSSGNSIFIARQLLDDPSILENRHRVQRIPGNVGQPGITFLVPPGSKPRMRAADEHSWTVINHSAFDGRIEDCFSSTSCQLSFTNYRMPITFRGHIHGQQHIEAYFIESVVSIHDSGKWVGDIDVLASLNSKDVFRVQCRPNCPSEGQWKSDAGRVTLASVDSWEEMMERSDGLMIVRAHGNWLSRLAAACFGVARGYSVVVLPRKVCWHCFDDQVRTSYGNEVFLL